MAKVQLTGQNLGRVFNFRSGYNGAMHFRPYEAKQPSLNLKSWHKQLLGYLPSPSPLHYLLMTQLR